MKDNFFSIKLRRMKVKKGAEAKMFWGWRGTIRNIYPHQSCNYLSHYEDFLDFCSPIM